MTLRESARRTRDLPPVLLGLAILLLLQMIGLSLTALLHLPVPGVVLGLVLLVLLGLWPRTRGILRAAEPAGTPLLAHLQLLFVPPGVGVVVEMTALARNALPIALAVGGSFVITLLVAGRLLQALLRRQDRRGAERGRRAPDGGPTAAGDQATGGAGA
ncbi:effector of murein hydrolase LrgA [Brachybacterium endophyticum]|uniref:Effector of murein hydrolase LrgA n=1 Tax=Brachybacterium endophyticum TaxID=2182385 RepID=A0A2U2RK90_9MICO|nr:CidA/LrgA family protein [Brachybacterium endophyticum]PWH06292.1 effector of murein hydrolase LrgA [Brachybacterium endophyticum]